MKQLIITADDFGMTLGVSRGILKAMTKGLVTQTCVMTNSPYFQQSMALAKEYGMIRLGVHLNATLFSPLTNKEALLFALDNKGNFGKHWLKQELSDDRLNALKNEFRQQINALLETGCTLSHINTHHGLGVYHLKIWEMLQQLSKEYNVPLRQERELGKNNSSILFLNAKQPLTAVLNTLQQAKANYIELCTHPGIVDDNLKQMTSFVEGRERDLDWLTNVEYNNVIRQLYQVVSFDEVKW